MTTTDAVRLTEESRALVDARLDTIDRMLVGRVPRSDRLAIVREVESQIHELLADRGSDSPDRDDVLAVLARLDPPEAYLPEETTSGPAVVRMPAVMAAARPAAGRDAYAGIARAGGIVGLVAMAFFLLMPMSWLAAEALSSELLFLAGVFGGAALCSLAGLTAIALAAYARLRGAWAIVGLVLGIVAPLLALIGGIILVVMING